MRLRGVKIGLTVLLDGRYVVGDNATMYDSETDVVEPSYDHEYDIKSVHYTKGGSALR